MARWVAKREKEQRDELLSAYLDGQLGADERARLEEQLATDLALRAELETLRRTVALVRDLPQVPVPRNFILPQTMAVRPRPVPLRSRRLFAPLLTAATSAVGLLFILVLVGEWLFAATSGRLAGAPAFAPTEQPQAVLITVQVEQDKGTAATTPALAMAAPTEDAVVEVAGEGEHQGESGSPAMPSPVSVAPAAEEGGPATAPTIGAAAPDRSAAAPSPSPTATVAAEAYAASPTPTEASKTASPPDERREAMLAAGEQPEQEAGTARRPVVSPWRALEITLGLSVLVLGALTIWAWRVRR